MSLPAVHCESTEIGALISTRYCYLRDPRIIFSACPVDLQGSFCVRGKTVSDREASGKASSDTEASGKAFSDRQASGKVSKQRYSTAQVPHLVSQNLRHQRCAWAGYVLVLYHHTAFCKSECLDILLLLAATITPSCCLHPIGAWFAQDLVADVFLQKWSSQLSFCKH